jgi:predicted transcriptional regulator
MKKTNLGELEQRVMEILWTNKQCSAREVLVVLEKEKKLAYTTVATILQRLFDKGLVTRKEQGIGHIYSPKVSKERYTTQVAQSFLKGFIDSFGDTAIASFAESIDKLPEKKRKYFLNMLDEYDQNK